MSSNSFQTLSTLEVNGRKYSYHSLPALEKKLGVSLKKLPYSIRILLENLLRLEDGKIVTAPDIEFVAKWNAKNVGEKEIQFMPARVLLQDFTGVPVVTDLAAMRNALKRWGGDPSRINPLQPVDLVIDHSVQVDSFGRPDSLEINSKLEFERNQERYEFLKWAQSSFKNFRVVPPNTGICHQVNLEYLAQVALTRNKDGVDWIFPDTVIGTDSHTPMVNGLGVVGWGVGGIEAEAAMLGQPCTMLVPEVVGFKLKGQIPKGVTATDLVLTVTQSLRKKGVVGKFVEFFGPGYSTLTVEDRATLGNMSPEYGSTIGVSPVDQRTINYLHLSNREEAALNAEAYFKAQDLFFTESTPDPEYSDVIELDLATVELSLSGPARPQDRVTLSKAPESFENSLRQSAPLLKKSYDEIKNLQSAVPDQGYSLSQGDVVIAAITSCTNTSNPYVLLGAGLLAKNAVERGLKTKPWVKTSFGPGSTVSGDYLTQAGLMPYLNELGFNIVGYGCTTCIGNSGPLPPPVAKAVSDKDLSVGAVLSGNRNFEARIHPQVRANYLASPPLVVAYALAGSLRKNLATEPIGNDDKGTPVFLKDIYPSDSEIIALMRKTVTKDKFKSNYSNVFKGSKEWENISSTNEQLYNWSENSTYLKEPPFFHNLPKEAVALEDIQSAQVLAYFGDFITTDHISPAGNIGAKSVAGKYLQEKGVKPEDFNSFGARRGNFEVMVRGTFANSRIKNKLLPNQEGPITVHIPTETVMPIADAAEKYRKDGTPLIVLAGKEYGTGSSRDWAAKGTRLQGVRAVIAENFERIHRSNLVGMGVLPLQFAEGQSAETLGLTGFEKFTIRGLRNLKVKQTIEVEFEKAGRKGTFNVMVRIDTPNELEYFQNGGILEYVLRQLK